jgi:electron transport complex protein RnfC
MTRSSHHLSHFHGGLTLAGRKSMSTAEAVQTSRLPSKLIVPLQQHIGDSGELLVQEGDRVLKGQPLTRSKTYVSAPVHAPTSGTVSDIGDYPIPYPSGLSTPCVVISVDGEEQWTECTPVTDYTQIDPGELRNRVRQAGIVGLGGATFPTAVKLNPGPDHAIDTLIINGVECEPYITCDDMLMRERPLEVIDGTRMIMHILQAKHAMIAIEDNKPEAVEALKKQLQQNDIADIEIVVVPTRYPSGGEKQLIKIVTGKEVPSDGLPSQIGIVMQNVATAASVYGAIARGEPLISRLVTVTGDGVQQPQNFEVLVGTPMAELIDQAGGYKDDADRLIMGGPMMGFTLSTDQLPVTKGCNCLLVKTRQQTAEAVTMPCIRCGECVKVCPAGLLPQQLYWHASSKNFDLVQDYHLFDCIECGCCAYVCPSNIPLVQYYRFAKTEIWNQEREKQKSDHARIRHEFRQARLEQEKREREERLRKKKEMLEKKKQQDDENKTGEDPKKAAIAAALERVKAKKAKPESDAPAETETADSAPSSSDNNEEKTPSHTRQLGAECDAPGFTGAHPGCRRHGLLLRLGRADQYHPGLRGGAGQ